MAHRQLIECTLYGCESIASEKVVSDYGQNKEAPFCPRHIDQAVQKWIEFEQEAKERDRR